jgi:hypothetical protein
LPYVVKNFSRCAAAIAVGFSLVALLAATPKPATSKVHLAWRAPAKDSQFDAASSVQQDVTFQMSAALKAMAGHRADPIFVVEDRTRTFTAETGDTEISIVDSYARRHGGPNNTDPTVKRRTRKQIITFEPSGQYGIEPFLCTNEPPLDDAHANPTTFSKCPAGDTPSSARYEDPGDAALSELPAGPIDVGQSWTFTRNVVVEREEGSGSLNFVDTLARVDERGNQHIAVIDVTATGRINPSSDLAAHGFHTATMTLTGTAEFNLDQGTPGTTHYSDEVEFHASIMGANIGYTINEIYDGSPWTVSARKA